MPGAEGVQQVAVVLAALVGVADQQADRGAGGPAFVDAGQDLHAVGLGALRDMAVLARAAAVQLGLDVGFGQFHPGWAAIDHTTDGRAVTLAEVGHAKEFAEEWSRAFGARGMSMGLHSIRRVPRPDSPPASTALRTEKGREPAAPRPIADFAAAVQCIHSPTPPTRTRCRPAAR
jgi:hypothetical protein